MKENVFNLVQLSLAAVLALIILLQQKGSSLGSVFGGSSNIYSTKRGVDKILHYTTIATSIIFFGFSLARPFL